MNAVPSQSPDLQKTPTANPPPPSITAPPPASDQPTPTSLTPEEQMALFEQELKETDWGHQPC